MWKEVFTTCTSHASLTACLSSASLMIALLLANDLHRHALTAQLGSLDHEF